MKTKIKYIYGQITRGIPYRVISRILHKFDLHYMPRGNIAKKHYCELTKKTYLRYQYWCKWCGLRDTKVDYTKEVKKPNNKIK